MFVQMPRRDKQHTDCKCIFPSQLKPRNSTCSSKRSDWRNKCWCCCCLYLKQTVHKSPLNARVSIRWRVNKCFGDNRRRKRKNLLPVSKCRLQLVLMQLRRRPESVRPLVLCVIGWWGITNSTTRRLQINSGFTFLPAKHRYQATKLGPRQKQNKKKTKTSDAC